MIMPHSCSCWAARVIKQVLPGLPLHMLCCTNCFFSPATANIGYHHPVFQVLQILMQLAAIGALLHACQLVDMDGRVHLSLFICVVTMN